MEASVKINQTAKKTKPKQPKKPNKTHLALSCFITINVTQTIPCLKTLALFDAWSGFKLSFENADC